jgi:hypothetical protein
MRWLTIKGFLIQALTSAAAEGESYYGRLSHLIERHTQQFEDMVDAFFNSYHKWVPIVHQGSFREHRNLNQSNRPQEFNDLILVISLLTRLLTDSGKPGSLRISLYSVLKRLLWDPESIGRSTLALVESGVSVICLWIRSGAV